MCLILFAWQPDDRHHLIVAANRDEFYQRPSQTAHFWDDHPRVLGGRDLQAGGTWLGVTRSGRFTAVTNFKEEPPDPLPPCSRGDLTSDYLCSQESAEHYLSSLAGRADKYRGFNLLVGGPDELCYFSNHSEATLRLEPGTYGLSNQRLNCDWPKVVDGKKRLQQLIEQGLQTEDLFDLLSEQLPGQELSCNKFISTPEYGTCASTLLIINRAGHCYFEERTYGPLGDYQAATTYEFDIDIQLSSAIPGKR